MKYKALLLFVFFVCTCDSFSQATNGEILTSKKYNIITSYESLSDFMQWYFPKEIYNEVKNQSVFECLKITYSSDKNSVEGFIYKPIVTNSKKYPVIIWNRGGTGNFGKFNESDLVSFYQLAKKGYIIVASNLRYIDDKERYDQAGGDDLNDIMNLIPLIKKLDYADSSNLFMVGFSRGALMTHLAIKNKIPINAATVIAGVTDAYKFFKERPEFINGWNKDGYVFDGLKNNLPDFEKNKKEYLRQRSVVYWADKINTPLLILHSRTDKRVPVENSIHLAAKLQNQGKVYSLVIYDDDGHSLPKHKEDVYNKIFNWFEKFKQ
jgi:dipeptidyl aminopeptidase/acylaminoacyl peptidase